MAASERSGDRAIRVLVVAVVVEVLLAAVLRAEPTWAFLRGDRRWESVLSTLAVGCLLVVVVALVQVIRHDERLRGQLRRENARVTAMQETSGEWMWETTPDLVLTYSSRQLSDVLGYEPSDVVGRDAHEFMDPTTARRSRQAMEAGLLSEGWTDVRTVWRSVEGQRVVLRHSGAPLYDRAGRLLGYRGSCSLVPAAGVDAHRQAIRRQRVEQVVAGRSLQVALQPVIDVGTGRLEGAEALARFADGRPPNLWFDEAGTVGLRYDLELLAIEVAVSRLGELPEGTSLAVNSCPEVIADSRFLQAVVDTGVPLDRLVLEVTEHVRVEKYEVLAASVQRLRAAGARIAVDDAGAGYASLAHVLQLRPDIVKIDRSLVAGVDSDRARQTLITALVLLSRDIGATVTAEGVETAAELEAVVALGVQHAQGYLIGRPSVDARDWHDEALTRDPPGPRR